MTKRDDLVKKLEEIADELTDHLTSLRFAGRTLVFKYKTHEYKREHSSPHFSIATKLEADFRSPRVRCRFCTAYTRSKTISGAEFRGKEEIFRVGLALMEKELPLKIRLMGLRVTNLRDLDLEKKGGLDGVSSSFSLCRFLASQMDWNPTSADLRLFLASSSLAPHRRRPSPSRRRKEEDQTAKTPSLSISLRTTKEE